MFMLDARYLFFTKKKKVLQPNLSKDKFRKKKKKKK